MKPNGALVWIKDQHDPKLRQWEEFYRNRWQHDKIVRSTHGVNCTGVAPGRFTSKTGLSLGRCKVSTTRLSKRLCPLTNPADANEAFRSPGTSIARYA